MIVYVPVYAIVSGPSLLDAPWRDLILQAPVHGLLVAVISLTFFGRAVSLLGASNGSAFAALAPAITAILAIPILGEWPASTDWIAMLLISGGVYVASGAPLPAVETTLNSMIISAVCVGGTFMVITMAGMQEVRRIGEEAAPRLMAAMTAAFAAGQLAGPLTVHAAGSAAEAIRAPSLLAAALLLLTALVLMPGSAKKHVSAVAEMSDDA